MTWHLFAKQQDGEMAMMRTDRADWQWMMDNLPGVPLWDMHFETEASALSAIELGRATGVISNCGCFVIRDNGRPLPHE